MHFDLHVVVVVVAVTINSLMNEETDQVGLKWNVGGRHQVVNIFLILSNYDLTFVLPFCNE
jgi:hypothetical protein